MVFSFGAGRGTPWDGADSEFSTSSPGISHEGSEDASADLFGERYDQSFGAPLSEVASETGTLFPHVHRRTLG
jgi:hypothetical protein